VGGELPRLVESKLPLLADAARGCRLSLGRTELRDAAGEVEWAKATQTRPEDYVAAASKASRVPPVDAADVARLYDTYERLRRERNLLDFEAMLELTVAVIAEHAEVARSVRDQYRYFVVDEYQDVNPLQKLLLDTWVGEGRDDVCVVGDPNQTIYSFTGATPAYLLGFSVEHPECLTVRLVRDYRSTRPVVALANRLATGRHAVELVAQRQGGPDPTFREFADEAEEAKSAAKRTRMLMDEGVPAREIAVLFRTNGQSETYEQALADAGVPYVVKGGERFFEREEVRKAVMLLRGAVRSASDEPLVAAVRGVLSGVGFGGNAPAGRGAARERWESLAALAQLAEDMAAVRPGVGVAEFVAELEDRAAAQHAPPLEGVTLASLHAAKGLEWDAVFIVGLVEGMLPIVYATTADQVEEERRLLYVGVTRARVHLSLSWALARAPGGRKGRRPSRFLDGVGTTATASPPRRAMRRPAATGPQPCRVCGRPLTAPIERKLGRCQGCPADFDEGLLAALKEWRAAASRAQSVPAYVVFTDATLQAIAERVPERETDLAAIPGVGAVKLTRYGSTVLAICRGESPAAAADLID
jgi:DNA helicase-2/ATP-dependent DNA helicase PcrA